MAAVKNRAERWCLEVYSPVRRRVVPKCRLARAVVVECQERTDYVQDLNEEHPDHLHNRENQCIE